MPSPLPFSERKKKQQALHSSIEGSGYSGENMDAGEGGSRPRGGVRRGGGACNKWAREERAAPEGSGARRPGAQQAGLGSDPKGVPREAAGPTALGLENKGQPRAAWAPLPRRGGGTRGDPLNFPRCARTRPLPTTPRPRVLPYPSGPRGAGRRAGAAWLGTHLEDQPRHLTRYSNLPCGERGSA